MSDGPSLWDLLPAEVPAYGEFVAHRVHTAPDVFVANDHEAAPHLLVALPATAELRDERSRGIRVVAHPLRVEARAEAPFIDVVSTEPAGREMFRLVTGEIVDAVRAGSTPLEAVQSTLARWRRFWASVPEMGLTAEQVRGLFGELWFLFFWLLPQDLQSVNYWHGPEGARHDFQWLGHSVESKTTNSVRGHIHRINGVDQLSPPEQGTLHLFSLRVRDEPNALNSLPALIEQIRTRVKGDAALADRLDTGLARAGYSPAHAERYRDQKFIVIDERLYRVDAGFPRLIAASFVGGVPIGVERIDYDVNLESADAFCVARKPAEFPAALIAVGG